MNDLGSLVSAAERLRLQQKGYVLATVVKVEGSAYRRPGARLLFDEDGVSCGSVSGGCLERDLKQRALWRLGDEGALVVRYDARGEEEGSWLSGCQGAVDVLLERQGGATPFWGTPPLAFSADCLRKERPGVLVTIFRSEHARVPVGTHLAWRDGGPWGSVGLLPAALVEELGEAARVAASREEGFLFAGTFEGRPVEALVEVIRPAPHLFVFGGGEDAVPVVTFAKALGWSVTVCEASARWQWRERFVHADEIHTGALRQAAVRCAALPRGFAVLMSHDFRRDAETLGVLLAENARYVGVLGPRPRTERLLEEVRAAGGSWTRKAAAAIHSPVGLAVGAETPEEIALSIVAEIQATLGGARAGFLRDGGALHTTWGTWRAGETAAPSARSG